MKKEEKEVYVRFGSDFIVGKVFVTWLFLFVIFFSPQISGQSSDCGGITFPKRSKDQNESEFVDSRKLHSLFVVRQIDVVEALQMNFVCLYDPKLTHLRIANRSLFFCYSMMPN